MDVGTQASEAELDKEKSQQEQSRCARLKRHLDEAVRDTKKARAEMTKKTLESNFLRLKLELNRIVDALYSIEDEYDSFPLKSTNAHGQRMIDQKVRFYTTKISQLKDKRQLLLDQMLKAEDDILDFTGDE